MGLNINVLQFEKLRIKKENNITIYRKHQGLDEKANVSDSILWRKLLIIYIPIRLIIQVIKINWGEEWKDENDIEGTRNIEEVQIDELRVNEKKSWIKRILGRWHRCSYKICYDYWKINLNLSVS